MRWIVDFHDVQKMFGFWRIVNDRRAPALFAVSFAGDLNNELLSSSTYSSI